MHIRVNDGIGVALLRHMSLAKQPLTPATDVRVSSCDEIFSTLGSIVTLVFTDKRTLHLQEIFVCLMYT